MFRYFISYQVSACDEYTSGFGHCEFRVPFRITGIDGIDAIAERIEQDNNYVKGSVIILNYKLFDFAHSENNTT